MALRTIPVAIQHAKTVQRYAPGAWIINFTNPAGIITQALSLHTRVRAVGICDTPAELIHQIRLLVSRELQLGGADAGDAECPYFGLNHLGWVRDIRVNGQSLLDRVLEDDHCLRQLYPADLFDCSLLRELRLIPTEYLYYYYYQQRAFANQIRAGVTRGEELAALNTKVLDELRAEYEEQGRGFRLVEIAEGWQLLTRPGHAAVIRRLHRIKSANRLTRPALETLAIISYKQPLTKAEIESIRGVGSDGHLGFNGKLAAAAGADRHLADGHRRYPRHCPARIAANR